MKNFKFLISFILGFSLSGLIWGIISIFLSHRPYFYINTPKYYSFYHINLYHLFFKNSNFIPTNTITLTNIKLKATFLNGKKSFILIKDKSKTLFLNLNDTYKGYKLIKIMPNKAIFYKNGKNYEIKFKKEKIKNMPNFQNTIVVSKKTFEEYKNNLNKIWQNIGIIKVNEGYLVTFVKKHSIFEKIGLKRGDILLEINGRRLRNDTDAWDLYRNADKFRFFEIKIKRNHKIKVITYEMD